MADQHHVSQSRPDEGAALRNNNLPPRGTRPTASVTQRSATDPQLDATSIVDALHTDTHYDTAVRRASVSSTGSNRVSAGVGPRAEIAELRGLMRQLTQKVNDTVAMVATSIAGQERFAALMLATAQGRLLTELPAVHATVTASPPTLQPTTPSRSPLTSYVSPAFTTTGATRETSPPSAPSPVLSQAAAAPPALLAAPTSSASFAQSAPSSTGFSATGGATLSAAAEKARLQPIPSAPYSHAKLQTWARSGIAQLHRYPGLNPEALCFGAVSGLAGLNLHSYAGGSESPHHPIRVLLESQGWPGLQPVEGWDSYQTPGPVVYGIIQHLLRAGTDAVDINPSILELFRKSTHSPPGALTRGEFKAALFASARRYWKTEWSLGCQAALAQYDDWLTELHAILSQHGSSATHEALHTLYYVGQAWLATAPAPIVRHIVAHLASMARIQQIPQSHTCKTPWGRTSRAKW